MPPPPPKIQTHLPPNPAPALAPGTPDNPGTPSTPVLPPALAPLDPQSFTHPPPPLPYSYATLLLHAFVISAVLLAVPYLAYWMFLRVRKWRGRRAREMVQREWDEERNIGATSAGGERGVIDTVRGVLWGSLRGLTGGGGRSVGAGWSVRGTGGDGEREGGGIYNSLTLPLSGMQVKRVEVKRGRTLQKESSRGIMWGVGREYKRREDYNDAAGNNRYWNGYTGEIVGTEKRRAVSGPYGYGYGLASGWGRSVQSTGQQVQIIGDRNWGSESSSTASSGGVSLAMATVRKRSVGIPVVGIDGPTTQMVRRNNQPQRATGSDVPGGFGTWDDIPLRETGNGRVAVAGVGINMEYGTRALSGQVKKENLNTNLTAYAQHQQHRGNRNEKVPNADTGHQERQHWWKGWMRENKRGILTEGGNMQGSLLRDVDRNREKSGALSGKMRSEELDLGLIPPVGSPRRVDSEDRNNGGVINPAGFRYYMRGARNESFHGALGVAGDGNGESASASASGGESSPSERGDSSSREWRWARAGGKGAGGGRNGGRYDGREDSSSGTCEDLRYARLIAASQSSEWWEKSSSTGGAVGETSITDTSTGTGTGTGTVLSVGTSAIERSTDTSTTEEVRVQEGTGANGDAAGDQVTLIQQDSPLPLAVWVNEYAGGGGADSLRKGPSSAGTPLPRASSGRTPGEETPRPVLPEHTELAEPIAVPASTILDRASAYFASSCSPASAPSTPRPILKTTRLEYQSPRPITPPTGTPSIRFHISRPTRHLFLQKVFEPHIRQYGNLLLPPLSRILYEKWQKHSIPLCQKEPGLEEGWRLGLGDGRRERDRWLRLRSGPYEGQGVDGLLTRGSGMKRRCSDPGVRRCIGKMWTQAVDFVRTVEEDERGVGGVGEMCRLKGGEARLGKRGLGVMYFPEWFSPGWESGEEEIFRWLCCDDEGEEHGEGEKDEGEDEDVNIVLKHVARQKRRELTELLREFSEEMFLKEVDSRLEWWWWQTRGTAAGLEGREAERRREILLRKEERMRVEQAVEMEKEYFDKCFGEEIEEGRKWKGWRWELDVPTGVRDYGAYCFPRPPQGSGGGFVDVGRRASVGGSKVDKEKELGRWGVKFRHDPAGWGVTGLGERMLERARRLVRGEESGGVEEGGLFDTEGALLRGRDTEGGSLHGDDDESMVMGAKLNWDGGETVSPSSSIVDLGGEDEHEGAEELEERKQGLVAGDGGASARPEGEGTPNSGNEGNSTSTITRKQKQELSKNNCDSGSGSMEISSQSRSRPWSQGKGMTVLMHHRRRRRAERERCNLANADDGWPSLLRDSETSAGSGYAAGDEEGGKGGGTVCEALRLSEETLSGLGLLEGTERGGSRVVSDSKESVQSNGSGESVESVSSGYGESWGWSRLGVRTRRRGSEGSHARVSSKVEEALPSTTDGDHGFGEENVSDGDDTSVGEAQLEVELIPEDVRGSWGRNGGYLNLNLPLVTLGVDRAASEGDSKGKRGRRRPLVLSELDVSAPEMGSRNITPFERAKSAAPARGVLTSESELNMSEGVGNPPWFMSLRRLSVPGGSSAGATSETASNSAARLSDGEKERRKGERWREVGRRVREVGTERDRERGGIEVEVLESGGRRVVSEPRGGLAVGMGVGRAMGVGVGLTAREAERRFWERSIRREVEGLWGPVREKKGEKGVKAQMDETGEGAWMELD